MKIDYVLSIIVCTHNRGEVLVECLESLDNQGVEGFELIIVDNASSDNTQSVVQQFAKGKDWVQNVICEEVGLSRARNCGAKVANSKWVGYLDDDALVEPDFVSNVLLEIERGDFQAFGGVYTPWYRYGRPYWYSDTYGGTQSVFEAEGRRRLKESEHFSGGIAFYQKHLIIQGEGFSPNFGMHGQTIGYREENVLQDELKSQGCKLGIVPSITMKHMVAAYKLNLTWHLKSQFEGGRAYTLQYGRQNWLIGIIKLLIFPYTRVRRVFDANFKGFHGYIIGMIVMVLRGYAFYWGRMYTKERCVK